MLPTLPLGSSSTAVSRLAYGCWRIAESADHAQNLATAGAAIEAALDAGYTLFDFADIYGGGRSESVFGEWLQQHPAWRSRMVIASKCGIRLAGDGGPQAGYRYDASAEHITRSCEESLRRLRVETIDLYQLHRPDCLLHPEEVAQAFAKLRLAGKVREFGVSNFRPSQVEALRRACDRPLVCQQVEISLLQTAPLFDGTLDQCLAERLAPLAWSPLARGLLADGAADLLPGQRGYQPGGITAELDRLATERGVSRSVLALAWLLKHPAGIIPIIGSTQPARIREAASAAAVVLSREEWYRLLLADGTRTLP